MKNSFFTDDTVFVLDSYGLIYREYYAFITRPLTNRKNENISAIFGFFRNLGIVLKNYKPKFMVAAMDSKTPTFRHEFYAQYKATRQKTPDDLKAQFPWIEEMLSVLGIPVVRCDGYEADDVVATIAAECEKQNRHCCILSADKDLMQLVSDNVHILRPDKTKTWAEKNASDVEAEWGVVPEKLLDLLSLVGDTADNVPGVNGVGDKTAQKLLNEYGSLEEIFSHVEEIKGAVGKKLADGKENAFFSKKLITLCNTVPCVTELSSFNIENLNFAEFSKEILKREMPAIAKTYSELGNVLPKKKSAQKSLDDGEPSLFGNFDGEKSAAGNPHSLGEEFFSDILPENVKKNSGEYTVCATPKALREFVDSVLSMEESVVAFDTETDSLDTSKANLVGMSFSAKAGTGIYVPLILEDSLFSSVMPKKEAFDELKRLFENEKTVIVMHNAKFDLKVLAYNGFFCEKLSDSPKETQITNIGGRLFDTMIAAWVLESDRQGKTPYSLEYLAETKLGLKGTEYAEIVPKDKNFAFVPVEQAAQYSAEDSDFTLQLYNFYKPKLKALGVENLFNSIEMEVLPVLAQMEINGIHLSPSILEKYSAELQANISSIEKEIYSVVGHEFNIASPKQLSTVLFEERGLKGTKKTKTGYSTDTAVLESLRNIDVVPEMILDFRAKSKLLSTYVETLPKMTDEESRIHTTFMQTGTATGRLSSKDPNLQNIPVRSEDGRRIRGAFTAKEGTILISADYSQIELVLLAHLSGDENLCAAFREGVDVHRSTASLIYGVNSESVTPEMRRNAKTLNFGLMYGMSAFSLASSLSISRFEAARFIENYFLVYSGVKKFFDDTIIHAEENGFVTTLKGRRRYIPSINSPRRMEKEAAVRIAKNTPIQGSAADIVKQAMINLNRALKKTGLEQKGVKMLLQVHDELIFECPDDEILVKEAIKVITEQMESAEKLSVPLKVSVEYGKNWGEFH